MTGPVVILGCGYTGKRVRRRLEARGIGVVATSRSTSPDTVPFEVFGAPLDLRFIPRRARILYSIPDVPPSLVPALADREPARIVYISTTGVYGKQREINEDTPVEPDRPEMEARVAAEQAILGGPWSSAVLRPAAIYGPDRGVHRRIAEGTFALAGEGGNYISRIHVEDLAAAAIAMLDTTLGGAWPVADEHPCPSAEIADYCARLLGVTLPSRKSPESLHPTRRSDRRVCGRKLREILGLELIYPSYRRGISEALGLQKFTE